MFYEIRREIVWGFPFDEFECTTHAHTAIEFLYVKSGQAKLIVDNTLYEVKSGELAVIFPNCLHSYPRMEESTPSDGQLSEKWLLAAQIDLAGIYEQDLNRFRLENPVLPAELVPEDTLLIIRRLLEQDATGNPSPTVCQSYLQLLLALIWPCFRLKPNEVADYNNMVTRISQYIVQHFQQSITLADVAKEVQVSRYHLSRVFSEQLHSSFSELINAVRISEARDLLKNTDKSITQVLYECGFESQATFSRVFRKMCGMSAREYRREARK